MVGKDHAHPGGNMTRPSDSREEIMKNALTAFGEARVGEGFRVETYTDTHAIIVPADQRSSFLDRFRGPGHPTEDGSCSTTGPGRAQTSASFAPTGLAYADSLRAEATMPNRTGLRHSDVTPHA
jgi:hypothetical protein